MPQQTAYKTDENGNVVPFTYIAPAPPNPMQEQQKLIDQAYRDLPLQQAEEAAKAAMVYQGQRGYMRDLANGLSAPEALSKWAPLMFARTPGQGASMIRANPTQQQPRYFQLPNGTTAVGYGNSFSVLTKPPPPKTPAQEESLDMQRRRLALAEAAAANKPEPREYLNPRDQAKLGIDEYELKKLLDERRALVPESDKSIWGIGPKGNAKEIADLDAKIAALQDKISSYGKQQAPPSFPPTTPGPVTQTAPAAPSPAPTISSVKRFTFDPKTRKIIAK